METLHRRSRHEQSECVSPEVSLKQQRINTARKAKAIAHMTVENDHPQTNSSSSNTHKTTTSSHSINGSSSSGSALSAQEALLVRNASMAKSSSSVDDYLNRDTEALSCGLPLTCCPYDMHFLQATLLHKDCLPPALPLVPSKGAFSSLSFLFKFASLLSWHPGHFSRPLHIDIVNTPLFEGDPFARASAEYNATAIFDKFCAAHSLLEASPASNGVSRMTQVELAVLLLFLHKAADSSQYFIIRREDDVSNTCSAGDAGGGSAPAGAGAGAAGGGGTAGGSDAHAGAGAGAGRNSQVLDTAVNGLLAALSDKRRGPRELGMAVACLSFAVQHHSLATRVLTASNSAQLVKLLLSKCVYPTEVSERVSEREDACCSFIPSIARLLPQHAHCA